MNIYSTSDIHIDFKPNRDWLGQLSRHDYQDDVLILAGDISDSISHIANAFKQLSSVFKYVLYIPGNHDLWVKKSARQTSMQRFEELLSLAQSHDILTTPLHLPGISIVPLYSWYDFSFGPCDDYLQQRWMDFVRCQWGDAFSHLPRYGAQELALNEYFLSLNDDKLGLSNDCIISFSHFLPRIDVMPSYIPEIHQKLYPILGTSLLDEQIRKLDSDIHIYGHSHVNRDEIIDGIRYINNAFGYPHEERITAKRLKLIMPIP